MQFETGAVTPLWHVDSGPKDVKEIMWAVCVPDDANCGTTMCADKKLTGDFTIDPKYKAKDPYSMPRETLVSAFFKQTLHSRPALPESQYRIHYTVQLLKSDEPVLKRTKQLKSDESISKRPKQF